MEDYTIIAIFSAGMIFFLVLPHQPRMVINEIDRICHIVVNVTDDVSEEDKELENTIFDVVANPLKVLRCHLATSK